VLSVFSKTVARLYYLPRPVVLVVGLLVVTCDLDVFFVCCIVAAVSGEILVLSACAALIACIKVGLFSDIIISF
jgi:hypothetical protein